MKTRLSTFRFAVSLLAVLALTIPLFAQDTPDHHKRPHYKLTLVPPPAGGSDSFSVQGPSVLHVLNNQGTLGSLGFTPMPDPFFGFVIHAIQTRKGTSNDLGALPPAVTNTSGATAVSDGGLTAGGSENGQIDPLTGFPEFQAVTFSRGDVTRLGNFGGNGSIAFSANNRGQIVGYALNTIPDPYGSFLMGCSTFGCFPTGQQMRAALWDKGSYATSAP